MHAPSLRGPLYMVAATCSYVINDTFMKLATEGLPPYEVLFLRGVTATLWSIPLLIALGLVRQLPALFEPRVLARNLLELFGVLCFIVALTNMPIADATALGQITPLIVLLGAAFLFGERIGPVRLALIGLGFVGAILIAQPTMAGISFYAVLALANAAFAAARDLASRRIAGHVPGMIVAISAVIVVLVGAGAMHLATEAWVYPSPRHMLLLAGSGFFLIFGHFFIFMAYRVGPTDIVAPFYYCFTVWAVISGLVVFGHMPNLMAWMGILLVVGSGLVIVAMDRRRRRPTVIA
ncbi:MAG: DMT family transporter [Mesorhizobium sp.]|nr:DMT family transporter [Mesorhizobium sp.]MCO5159794.1 DMT family transporter [Mesorhizobium sp.]